MGFDSFANKIYPHEIEVEASVLGCILLDPNAIEICASIISPEAFYLKAHALLYASFIDLHEAGRNTDLLTASSYLKDNDLLEVVGGRSKLLNLLDATVSTVNVDNLCKLIKDKYLRRSVIQAGIQIAEIGYQEEKDFSAVKQEIQFRLNSIEDLESNFSPCKLDLVMASVLEQLENISQNGSQGTPTGYIDLDHALCGGINPGELVIVAGRPAMGKSAFAMTIALNMAKAGLPSLIFSLEMPKEQIASRFLSQEMKVDNRKFQMGVIEEEILDIISGVGAISGIPLWIDDSPYVNLSQIRTRTKQIIDRHGDIGCIVVDYLQLMGGSEKGENRQQEITKLSRGMKLMARELNCPVILLSQLNRAVESRQNKRPMLSDLRESGAIEQDSDLIIFLYRDEYYNPTTIDRSVAEVIVSKNRRGPTGTIKMLFDANLVQFKNLAF